MIAARIYLASFLFYRVVRFDGDKRFEKVKTNSRRFLLYWFIQGVWIIVTALPVVIANLTPRRVTMAAADYGALALALFGLAMEVTADMQKLSFRSEPANEDKFITTGLWSVSRHPNVSSVVAPAAMIPGGRASSLTVASGEGKER
jgi:steroid 5-alpha reductase family enzyme